MKMQRKGTVSEWKSGEDPDRATSTNKKRQGCYNWDTLVLISCHFWASAEGSYIVVDGLRSGGGCRCLAWPSICDVGGFALRAGPRDRLADKRQGRQRHCESDCSINQAKGILAVGRCKFYNLGLITEVKNYRWKYSALVSDHCCIKGPMS